MRDLNPENIISTKFRSRRYLDLTQIEMISRSKYDVDHLFKGLVMRHAQIDIISLGFIGEMHTSAHHYKPF